MWQIKLLSVLKEVPKVIWGYSVCKFYQIESSLLQVLIVCPEVVIYHEISNAINTNL